MSRLQVLFGLAVVAMMAVTIDAQGAMTKCYCCSGDEQSQSATGIACRPGKRFVANVLNECGVAFVGRSYAYCTKTTVWINDVDGNTREQVSRGRGGGTQTGVVPLQYPAAPYWGCRTHKENGVYTEDCYCKDDGCNSASGLTAHIVLLVLMAALGIFFRK